MEKSFTMGKRRIKSREMHVRTSKRDILSEKVIKKLKQGESFSAVWKKPPKVHG